jgi:DNA-binding MarR family transcriptional regulator
MFTKAETAATARPRREKLFGEGRPRALDRNAKLRITQRARLLMRRTQAGKAYGAITAKAFDVLKALVWGFHNGRSGVCFPSLERIAERISCARSTVALALKALEAAGLVSWVNRIVRRRVLEEDPSGKAVSRIRVMRTSNAYTFNDPATEGRPPKSSKSENPTGTQNQESSSLVRGAYAPAKIENSDLAAALNRLGRLVGVAV